MIEHVHEFLHRLSQNEYGIIARVDSVDVCDVDLKGLVAQKHIQFTLAGISHTQRKHCHIKHDIVYVMSTIKMYNLLTQLQNLGTLLDSDTKVLRFRNMHTCAFVRLVRVILEPDEQYETDETYHGRKHILQEKTIESGVDYPWHVIQSCHQFCDPMETEQEYIEIVLLKQNDPRVHKLWEEGRPRAMLYPCSFLFVKDWELQGGVLGLGDGDIIEVRLQPEIGQWL